VNTPPTTETTPPSESINAGTSYNKVFDTTTYFADPEVLNGSQK